jgi:1-hydroxycarotenoid 3,4-desaturase
MRRRRAAVIGGGFGGLAAAGVLARAGVSVTLFEAGDVPGGKARRLRGEGVVLDTGPTLLTMPDVVRDTFDVLGARDLVPRFDELAEQCAYRFADGRRFVATRALEPMLAAAKAFDPADAAGLRAFYDEAAALYRSAGEPYLEAPFEGMADFMRRVASRGAGAVLTGIRMGTLATLAARHLRSPPLRQFVGRYATYVGASPSQVSAAFALIPHLERTCGVHHVAGGMGALVDGFTAALRRLDVTLRLGARAQWRRRGAELVAGPPGGEISVDAVIVNADPLGDRAPEPLALSGYVLLLAVPRRLALPHHTVLFSRDYADEFRQLFAGHAPDDPTVHVCHPAATDPEMAAPGWSGLHVMVNAPTLRAPCASWPDAARMRARCLARLDAEVPGIARDARVLGERTPVHFARQGAPRGSLYGFLPRGRFGPFRRPRMRGGVPGVFYAGGGTHPGGGVPMVLLSGRFAAGLALRHLGRAA